MNAIRALLDHAIDYAGLFPPASLSLREATASYAEYRVSPEQWALGRFVLPVTQLAEFREVATPLLERGREAWELCAIGGADPLADLGLITGFNESGSAATITCFEFKAGTLDQFRLMAERGPFSFQRFAELRWDEPPEGYLTLMQSSLIGAKLRTGGTTQEAFPAPDAVLRHLEAVIEAGVPFKCTAGLHHPVRGQYRLTYASDAPAGTMYGYLNVMLAAAALRLAAGRDAARGILLEEDPSGFVLEEHDIRWRELRITGLVLSTMRAEGSLAFGSCSFREPMEELSRVPAG